MKNSFIIEVTNDEFEFIVDIYDTTEELALLKRTKPNNIRAQIYRPPKLTKTRYIRIWENKDEREL